MSAEKSALPKKRILMVLSGPAFEMNTWQKMRLEGISREYEGIAMIPMLEPMKLTVGSITINAVKVRRFSRVLGNLKFYLVTLTRVLRDRMAGRKWDLVTSYDPLKTGLLAAWVSAISGARFSCEVNGVYHDPKNYLDEKNPIVARAKILFYPMLMRYVLARASGIKIQYPAAVDPFKPVLRNPVIGVFFNLVFYDQMKNIEERKEVLFVGFPFRRKGVDILIAAFKKVAPKYPDWKLKILGWFPDMTELNAAMDKHPQIYHHPPVYNNEMPDHMGRCAFLVLPSRSEAGGRVLQEAMAASKPRLGADVDGIHMLIKDGVDGLLFKPEDVDDLALKLDTLMGDPEMRRRMGEAGRARMADYTAEKYFTKLLNYYRDVVTR